MKKTILILLILGLLVLGGCAKTQYSTQYVCPDGSTVSDASLCPKQGEGTQVECMDNSACPSGMICERAVGPNQNKCIQQSGTR